MYRIVPSLIQKPVAWEKFPRESPQKYFFLREFVDMTDQTPDPDR